MTRPISHGQALSQLGAGSPLLGATANSSAQSTVDAIFEIPPLKGRIKHSVCKWCYASISLDDLCASTKAMGLPSVELLDPPDFPVLAKYGLHCAMVSYPTIKMGEIEVGGITKAWNRVEHHDALLGIYTERLRAAADAGLNNVICFSGNREGLSDAQGLENCAIGLARLMPLAEKLKVTVTMELLNSKGEHPDYMCDHTVWGVALAQKLGSERFKLLYDIYHMQIMEGDVIATIRRNHQWISHYHTAGVPGRVEIDERQELNYPAIMRAIVETGYQGYVGQEFLPTRSDPLASLRQGVAICDV